MWAFLARRRRTILAAVGGTMALGLSLRPYEYVEGSGWLGVAEAFVREAYAWTTISALFGYAHRYIRAGSPALTTLTEAVFPFYIIHQTAIVLAGHILKALGLPVLVEAGTILTIEVAACVATYGLALAVPILRLPLGMKPAPRRPRASVAAAE